MGVAYYAHHFFEEDENDMTITVPQNVKVDVEEMLRQMMILYPYDLTARLIRDMVDKADDPFKLSGMIIEELQK